MGKFFVGAVWGAVLVLSIWCFTAYDINTTESVLPILSVFGLIGCGIGLVFWIGKIIIDNWD